jgi:hypothetical protein
MKPISIFLLALGLLCGESRAVIISFVDSPLDSPRIAGNCNSFTCDYPELQSSGQTYNELLQTRLFLLEQDEIQAIFGPILTNKPIDYVRPLFAPGSIGESGITVGENKRHTDYHAIGDIGYLEVHYGYNGESLATCYVYFRADKQFVPLKSTNDIPARNIWDRAQFAKVLSWLDNHMPKVTELGEVEVSLEKPTRIDLGTGVGCIVRTQDLHCDTVPYWLSFDLEKDTPDAKRNYASAQLRSVSKTNEPVGFRIDGKYYRFTPRLAGAAKAP